MARSARQIAASLGLAVEKLFRETLKREGNFEYVISTKIDKSTADRPHFFLAYGTKSREGLKVFRQTEYDALRAHARNRSAAKERKREERTGYSDMFQGFEAEVQEAGIDDLVAEQKKLAAAHVRELLSERSCLSFSTIVDSVLQAYMLRETNVKDICVQLAREHAVKTTWGSGTKKPGDDTIIESVACGD